MPTCDPDRIGTNLKCCPGCGDIQSQALKLCVSCVAIQEELARKEAEAKVQGIQGRYRLDVTV